MKFNNYCSGSLCWPLFWYPNLEQEPRQWRDSASWTCLTHVWWYFPAVEKHLRKVMQCNLIIHFTACCQLTWLNRTNIAFTEQTLGVHWFLNALHIKDVMSEMLRKLFLHRLLLERRRHLFWCKSATHTKTAKENCSLHDQKGWRAEWIKGSAVSKRKQGWLSLQLGKTQTRSICAYVRPVQLLYIGRNRSCLRSQVNPFLPLQTAYGKGGLHPALLVQ